MDDISHLLTNEAQMWDDIQDWSKELPGSLSEIVPQTDRAVAERNLGFFQVPAGNSFGAVILKTGGMYFHNHSIRLFGSNPVGAVHRDICRWQSQFSHNPRQDFVLVGDDIFGTFYAINFGGLDDDGIGEIFALYANDTVWVSVSDNYAQLLYNLLTADISDVLDYITPPNFHAEFDAKANTDKMLSYYPPLFTAEGGLATSSKTLVDVAEAYEFRTALGGILG